MAKKKVETDKYQLGVQTVSRKDGTVSVPKGAIIIGGKIGEPFYTPGENGQIVMSTINAIYYLVKMEGD